MSPSSRGRRYLAMRMASALGRAPCVSLTVLRPGNPDLLHEPIHELLLHGQLCGQDLQGDRPVHGELAGEVDFPHAALTEAPFNEVWQLGHSTSEPPACASISRLDWQWGHGTLITIVHSLGPAWADTSRLPRGPRAS
jgi:hypothetical protein